MSTDTNHTRKAGGKPSLMVKPSLTSRTRAMEEDWGESRILSDSKMGALTSAKARTKTKPIAKNKSNPRQGYKVTAAILFFFVTTVGGVVTYQYFQESHSHIDAPLAQSDPPVLQATQTASSDLPQEPTAQAAQIVNEEPIEPAPAVSASTLSNALENGITPQPLALENALRQVQSSSSSVPAVPPVTLATKTLAKKTATDKKTEDAAAKKPPADLARATTLAATTPQATPPVAAAEKDLNLLTALVAHNSATPQVENGAEALLKRCSTLEPERQAPCRMKACSGARASEAACKSVSTSTAPASMPPMPATAPVTQAASQALPEPPPTKPKVPADFPAPAP